MLQIVFMGDCQAHALKHVYANFIAPLRGEEVSFVGLYDTSVKSIAILRSANVVARQIFNVAKSPLVDQIRDDATVITFPAIFSGFLWPYSGQEAHVSNKPTALLRDGPYEHQMADKFLNGLIRESVRPEEALRRYLDLDIARVAHLERTAELHIEAQSSRDKETGFDFASIIEARLRDTCLFLTSSHPTLTLMAPLMRGVFARMKVGNADIERAICGQRVTPLPNSALPIHPGVISHFSLKFVNEQSLYPYMYEGLFTFAEFVVRYMTYTWNEALLEGISLSHSTDLTGALSILSGALQSSPNSAAGWRMMSALLQRMGKHGEAISAAKRAIALDPEDPGGGCRLAGALLACGDLKAAEEEVRRSISLFPTDALSYRVLAEVVDAAGRPREAIAASEMSVAIKPGDPDAIRLLMRLVSRNQAVFVGGTASVVTTVAAVPSPTQHKQPREQPLVGVPQATCRLHAPVSAVVTPQWHHMEDGTLGRFRWSRTAETTWPITYTGPTPVLLRFSIPVVMENKPGSASASYLRIGASKVPLVHRDRALIGDWLVKDTPPHEVTLIAPEPESPLTLRGVNDSRRLGLAILVQEHGLPTCA
jgi:tetratricopeptide (TPR) repeat protein